MKKIIAIALIFVLLLSLFTVCSFAEKEEQSEGDAESVAAANEGTMSKSFTIIFFIMAGLTLCFQQMFRKTKEDKKRNTLENK